MPDKIDDGERPRILAWRFTNGMELRDGRVLVVGETYRHDGPLVPCESGLHAPVRPIDALRYAPGEWISRVECSGEIVEHGSPVDKFVCRKRKVLWCANAEPVLRAFARRCASDVLHLWAAPDIVKEYLKTGDESKRDAARDAAWAAAWAAARDAAGDAAWVAAGDAAWAAAGDAAGDAARDAAWAAARDAAWAAAWAAARDAARDAAGDAAWAAAWAAARDAAGVAAFARYNAWLEEMLMELKPKAKKKTRRPR